MNFHLRHPKASTQWLGQPHQQAVSSGLHTPAASVDLTASSLDKPSTTPSVADLVKTIYVSKSSEILRLDVRREIWPDLYEVIVNEREFKALYDSGTQLLTVTWTTDVHEGLKWAIQPLIQAAEKNKTYVFETNTRIQFRQGDFNGMNLTPDFAFGKRASAGKQEYPIILESGFLQSPRSLETVAQCTSHDPRNPSAFPPPQSTPATFADFEAAATLHLGPIRHEGHQWAPVITNIEFIVYVKRAGTVPTKDSPATMQSWSITPNVDVPPLLHTRSEITDILRTLARVVIGKGPFDAIYDANHPFNIDWDDFNADVYRRLNFKAGTTLTRLLEDYHSELEGGLGLGFEAFVPKKIKMDKSTGEDSGLYYPSA
ncbi:hypothetical protein C8R44DRAFT_894755 [Mycena epipterygia]|nr:hypothetical protein C8R44DRAFT_894755 [Mycena epipterygia]